MDVQQGLDLLAEAYPEATCELAYHNAFELLVAVVLSAQCTDVAVNKATPLLFSRFPDAPSLAGALLEDVEECVRSLTFWRQKSRNITSAARILVEEHEGEVPEDLEELVALPGVGRKTAAVVRGYAFGLPGVAADTHVQRVSRRLGWTRREGAEAVEAELMALWPESAWTDASQRLVWHGRRVCKARRPLCGECPLAEICPSCTP